MVKEGLEEASIELANDGYKFFWNNLTKNITLRSNKKKDWNIISSKRYK